jgi:rubredoxin
VDAGAGNQVFAAVHCGIVWQNTLLFLEGRKKLSGNDYKNWMCIICGWVYEEEVGAPEEGLAPGTRWEDVPEYWVCPDCGAGKEDFEMIEI